MLYPSNSRVSHPNRISDVNLPAYLLKLQLSEVPGKVLHLMESTNTNTENTETTNSAAPARFVELQALIAGMADDFQKFYQGGNKAAGTRVRNSMQVLKTLAQTIRTEVQSIKNGGKPSADGDAESESESEPS